MKRGLASPARARGDGERGAILVIVLWVTTLMALLIAGFMTATRSDALAVGSRIDLDRADAVAQAGVARAALGLLDVAESRWIADGRPYLFSFAGLEVEVRVLDENGKLDLNKAGEEELALLLTGLGLESQEEAALLAALLDWRDKDDAAELLGAEDPEYRAEGYDYGAGDAPFRHLSELANVFGMTRERYEDLLPYVTVNGRGSGINPASAPYEVMQRFAGLEEGMVEPVLRLREERTLDGTALRSLLQGSEENFSFEEGPVYSVRVLLTLPSGLAAEREALIWLKPKEDAAYHVLEWRKPIDYTSLSDKLDSLEEAAPET